jgi:hypothetical protein
MWTVPAVVLNEGDREELERRVRAHTSSQRQVRRARVVLMAADGVSNRHTRSARFHKRSRIRWRASRA